MRNGVVILTLFMAGASIGAAQVTSTQPASQAASAPAATQPQRTPHEEAELALNLVDAGRARDALPLARSAFEREPQPGLGLLALGTALDANGQSFEAVDYLKQYSRTAVGQNDWRGYARLGSIYLRGRNFRLARAALEQAERLTASVGGRPRILVVIDYAESLAGSDRVPEARTLLDGLLRTYPEAGDEPRYWLMLASLLRSTPGTTIAAMDAMIHRAVDAGVRRAALLRKDDGMGLRQLSEQFGMAREMREQEIDTLVRIEKDATREAMKAGDIKRSKLLAMTAETAAHEVESMRRSKLVDALDTARKAVELDAADPSLRLVEARLWIALGDAATAERIVRQVIVETPSNAEAREMVKQFENRAPSSRP